MKFTVKYIFALLVVVVFGMVWCYGISFIQDGINTAVGLKYNDFYHEQNGKLGDLYIGPGTPSLYGGTQIGWTRISYPEQADDFAKLSSSERKPRIYNFGASELAQFEVEHPEREIKSGSYIPVPMSGIRIQEEILLYKMFRQHEDERSGNQTTFYVFDLAGTDGLREFVNTTKDSFIGQASKMYDIDIQKLQISKKPLYSFDRTLFQTFKPWMPYKMQVKPFLQGFFTKYFLERNTPVHTVLLYAKPHQKRPSNTDVVANLSPSVDTSLSMETVQKFKDILLDQNSLTKFIVHLIPMPAYKQQLFAASWKYIEDEFIPWLHAHNIPIVDDRNLFTNSDSYYDNYHLGPEANQQLAKKFGAEVDEIVNAEVLGASNG